MAKPDKITKQLTNVLYSPHVVCMSIYKWFNLDAKSKEIWDKLDHKAKYIILGYNSGTSSSAKG